jgi:prepilin-type N-terminal cleavage/methylation domain-containing protein
MLVRDDETAAPQLRSRDRRAAGPSRRAAGYTLLELMAASTLASVFAVVMASASSTFFALLGDLGERTWNLREADVVRTRIVADAKGADEAACSDGSTLLLTFGNGMAASQIQYTASDGALLRWLSVTDREVSLADVGAVTCTDLGVRGVEIDLETGSDDHPFRVYVHVAKKPGGGGGGGGGA